MDQIETQPEPIQPLPSKPQRNIYKTLSLLLGGVVLIFLLIAGWGLVQDSEQEPVKVDSSSAPTPSRPTEVPETTPQQETGIPITANTVSYAVHEGEFYLRYRGKIYGYNVTESSEPVVTTLPGHPENEWIGLVNAPAKVDAFDEVFTFHKLPNQRDFIFTMRWHPDFHVYLHRNNSLEEVYRSRMGNDTQDYNVPKLVGFAQDSTYAVFHMYTCWNCGGSKPETMLLNLATKQSKNIGKTSYFMWKNNGRYEYKDYIVKECAPTPTSGDYYPMECFEKPEDLPLKFGQM